MRDGGVVYQTLQHQWREFDNEERNLEKTRRDLLAQLSANSDSLEKTRMAKGELEAYAAEHSMDYFAQPLAPINTMSGSMSGSNPKTESPF